MSNLPERIWACMGGPMVGMFVSGGNNGGWPEYVRADIVPHVNETPKSEHDTANMLTLTSERDRLAAAVDAVMADRKRILEERDRGFVMVMERAERAEAEVARLTALLREAAIALRDDMMERAEFRMDTISGEQYRIVNAGNSAWMDFCAALKGEGNE